MSRHERRGACRASARWPDRCLPRLGVGAAVVLVALMGRATAVTAQDPAWPAVPPGAELVEAGRFSILAFPSESRLARTLLADALARDTFPGLPRPQDRVRIALAPSATVFRAWVGPTAPDWGAASAIPARRLIIMQGRDAGADAGEPRQTLRHELAHLMLAEAMGGLVPRWFDEGYASYAAGEWGREQVLATSLGLVWRGVPSFAALDSAFARGATGATRAYALAHRAVAELGALGGAAGLTRLFTVWRSKGSFDLALREVHGMTEPGFEGWWRARVRRQYGVVALAADLGALSLVLGVFLLPLWWQRRRRQRARLAALRARDAAQEARERASARAALLGEGPSGAPSERSPEGMRSFDRGEGPV
ncbi:MAG: peptidase MA family metallohydrolase [Gemmatimonadaceae bacterium]